MTFRRKRVTHRTTLKIIAFLILCLMMYSFRLLVGDQLLNFSNDEPKTCDNDFYATFQINIVLKNEDGSGLIWPEMFYEDIPSFFKQQPFDMRISRDVDEDYFNHPDSIVLNCDDLGGLELLISVVDTVEMKMVNSHIVHAFVQYDPNGYCGNQPALTPQSSSIQPSFAVKSGISVLLSDLNYNNLWGGPASGNLYASDFLLFRSSYTRAFKNYYIEMKDRIGDGTWEGDEDFIQINCDIANDNYPTFNVPIIIWGVNNENDFEKIESNVIIQFVDLDACGGDPTLRSNNNSNLLNDCTIPGEIEVHGYENDTLVTEYECGDRIDLSYVIEFDSEAEDSFRFESIILEDNDYRAFLQEYDQNAELSDTLSWKEFIQSKEDYFFFHGIHRISPLWPDEDNENFGQVELSRYEYPIALKQLIFVSNWIDSLSCYLERNLTVRPRIPEFAVMTITKNLTPDPVSGELLSIIRPRDFIIRASGCSEYTRLRYAIESAADESNTSLTELNHIVLGEDDIGYNEVIIWAYPEDAVNPQEEGVSISAYCFLTSNLFSVETPLAEVGVSLSSSDHYQCYAFQSCRERDSLALVALYDATDGPNWRNSWDLDQPISSWHGITLTEEGCVERLRLSNGLTGVIPAELGQLTNLKWLHLEGNQLTGEIPRELGQLSNLESLHLWGNQLSGEIPAELGQLDSLQYLELSGNQLIGEIPKVLGQLSNLEGLHLGGNQLNGEIPRELGQLSNLEELNLLGNDLTGEIPVELAQLSNLEQLYLSGNELTGEIPVELAQLTNLENLSLSGNELTGEIPVELAQLTNLENLSLSGNQLTGEIPVELGQLSNLEWLDLSRNDLTGEIPVELGQLSNLEWLDLSRNELTGEIPVELAQLSNLEQLYLSGNELTGEIPVELAQLTNLERLYLGVNELTGEIPVELAQLSNLEQLYLSGNELTGEIPVELAQLSNLEDLYLSRNELTGEIPVELAQLSNLEQLYLSGNELTGIIPAELSKLHNLSRFSICPGNNFIGPIPTFPNSPNLDVSSIDFSCITGARLQGSVYQTTACTDTTSRWPLDHIRIYYGQDSLLGTAHGDFDFSMSEGTFDIQAYPVYDELYELACPDSGYYRIEINDLSDTIRGLDFGFRAVDECPLMQVSLEAPRQRWCAENSMELHYRNIGSLDADSAWIEVKFPASITISETDHPYTVTAEGNWRFELGAVQRGSSGSIKLKNTVSCEVPFGTTLCVDVRIFPQYQCEKAYPVSSVSISVDATCEGDSIRFLLRNQSADQVTTYYQLIRDFTIIDSVQFTLPGKASMDVTLPGTGHTYVVMVQDGDSDPNNNPWSGVEQCGGAPTIQGILGQYPTQGNLHQNRLCRLLRGSYDPNDKLADPPGAGPEHKILPNLDIRYTVRFQNTGNDTAFAVVILDTIDTEVLDITTLRPGPANHPYTIQVKEDNVLEFIFHPIALPDSTTDKDGSQGYVSYQIEQQKDLPTGTQIGNRAAIYFDNNPVVLTNTYFHQVHRPESMISTGIPEATEAGWLKIYPNPSSGQITIQAEFPVDQIQVYDVVGRLVGVFREPVLDIQNPGIYFLKIVNGGNQMTRRVLIQK